MAYLYDSSSAVSVARFVLGDTNDVSPLLLPDQDLTANLAAYQAVIDATPLDLRAAIRKLALALATKYASQTSSVGLPNGLNASWSERVKTWRAIADGSTPILLDDDPGVPVKPAPASARIGLIAAGRDWTIRR